MTIKEKLWATIINTKAPLTWFMMDLLLMCFILHPRNLPKTRMMDTSLYYDSKLFVYCNKLCHECPKPIQQGSIFQAEYTGENRV